MSFLFNRDHFKLFSVFNKSVQCGKRDETFFKPPPPSVLFGLSLSFSPDVFYQQTV